MKRTLPVLGVVLLVGSGVVVQLPVVEPVAMWWDLGRPPHPWLTTSTDAAQQLQTTPPELQFEHTFYYGETCGRLETLQASTARGEQVPESLRLHFYDGLGHGLSLVDQTADEMVVQIDRFVQPVYRRNLYEGILRAYTEASAAEPDQVVPFAEAFVAQVGLDDPYNGVRIGLQRALGDDLPMAITTAQRYPQRYWPALYEELGWRSVVPRPTPPDHVFEAGPFAGQPSSRALVSYAHWFLKMHAATLCTEPCGGASWSAMGSTRPDGQPSRPSSRCSTSAVSRPATRGWPGASPCSQATRRRRRSGGCRRSVRPMHEPA